MKKELLQKISKMRLIAILRGITPSAAVAVADELVAAGFYFMEITLDSNDWQTSIEKIKNKYGDEILIGAGTVLNVRDVDDVHSVGGRAIISPNIDARVIQRSCELGMLSIPGCFTPSECFDALHYGADILKIFPADSGGAGHIKNLSTVLPNDANICPTGGVNSKNIKEYFAAGAFAVGIGGALYKPNKSAKEIKIAANALLAAAR